MSYNPPIVLTGDRQRQYAKQQIDKAPDGWTVKISDPTRSELQNKKLWPMLKDVADQADWHGMKLSKEEWKEMFTAGLKGSKVIPGLEGGFVTVGMSTSVMGKKLFADLITYIMAFGDQRGVVWSEPYRDDEYKDFTG